MRRFDWSTSSRPVTNCRTSSGGIILDPRQRLGDPVATIADDGDDLLEPNFGEPAAQPHDVSPDLRIGQTRVLPGHRRELLARERPARMAKKEIKKVRLTPRKAQ